VRRVLVTGASGFIGRRTVPLLVDAGFEVHAIAREPRRSEEGVEWHPVDLLSPSGPAGLVREVEASHLLHFAWCAEPGSYWSSPDNVRWLEASLRLFREFASRGGRALVAGTCAEYDWSYGFCSERATPLRPNSLYGSAKHALHLVLEQVARTSALSLAWARIFFLYGPGEHPRRFPASVIQSLLHGEPAACTSGTQIRDYLHVDDVAAAFVRILESDVQGPLNIASGEPLPVRELLLTIADVIGTRDLLRLGAATMRPDEPLVLLADTERLVREVGWARRFSLHDGVADAVAWWRRNMDLASASVPRTAT
jgi:nucleoside-diphosphate-sugar epimerase